MNGRRPDERVFLRTRWEGKYHSQRTLEKNEMSCKRKNDEMDFRYFSFDCRMYIWCPSDMDIVDPTSWSTRTDDSHESTFQINQIITKFGNEIVNRALSRSIYVTSRCSVTGSRTALQISRTLRKRFSFVLRVKTRSRPVLQNSLTRTSVISIRNNIHFR